MFNISDETEQHARREGVINNGAETVVKLAGGGTIRYGEEYVRVCDDDGRELKSWREQEFADDFKTAMGNVLQLAAACVEAGTRRVGVKTWILAGEINDTVTDRDQLIKELGSMLDANNTGEIMGSVLFIGEDDQLYTVTVEAEVVRPTREFAQSLVDDIEAEDIGPAARAVLKAHGLKPAGAMDDDCDNCDHPWDDHDNQTGCQHKEDGEPCDCPNKRGYDI